MPNTFPAINARGTLVQRPYSSTQEFNTSIVEQESGPRYAWAWRDTPLLSWDLTYPSITEAEAAVLEAFFASMGGRYDDFSFTDPVTGTTYTTCRFDQDEIEVQHAGPAECSVRLRIVQTA